MIGKLVINWEQERMVKNLVKSGLTKEQIIKILDGNYIRRKDQFKKGDMVVNKNGVVAEVLDCGETEVRVKNESGYWYEWHKDLKRKW